KIGVILPDTKSSARWETADRPFLEKAFTDAGVEFDIQNANGDAAAMQTIADQMIANGATVLAIVNLDNASGAAIQKKAADQGVETIDYDRLTLGGTADYYVSFDNTEVGKLQGEGLDKCLGGGDKKIVFLNGSPDDSNATAFSAGAHSVLDGKTYTVVAEQAVPKWDNQQAATIYEQIFTQQGGAVDGVLAANDGLGNAVISVNKKNNLVIPVTGQDATVQGLQNILTGDQCMTVYKAVKKEADALSKVAIALANGETPTTTGTVQDATGNREVQAILETPQAITKENVKDVVDDGYVTAADLCKATDATVQAAITAACTELGIS
ncbi:MAG TPA: substrate-binding domain-containing protein, partial [Nakamurella sp.]|nr:substrate-binding domain-containing protein [Nakamurella sp.]